MLPELLTMTALASQPGWTLVALEAKVPAAASGQSAVDGAERRITGLSPERRAVVLEVLEAMAATPATAQGVKDAWGKVLAALPGLERPDYSSSGEGPNRAALRRAAMLVLHGLTVRAARASAGDAGATRTLHEVLQSLDGVLPLGKTELLEEARDASRR